MRNWRILVLMAAGVGLAAAQEAQQAKPPAEEPKTEAPKADETKPAPEQQKKFEALDRALRRSWQAKTPVCAIPLLNVLKPLAGATTAPPDPMIIVPRGPVLKGEQVQAPAPSCDDVKKDDSKK